MVKLKQGDIIKIDFNPQSGHEQAGYRPAVVVSADYYNLITGFVIVCPITNTDNSFPLHIPLDNRTKTTGFVLCEHIKALDISSRNYRFVERMPDDILTEVIDTVYSEFAIESDTYSLLDAFLALSHDERNVFIHEASKHIATDDN